MPTGITLKMLNDESGDGAGYLSVPPRHTSLDNSRAKANCRCLGFVNFFSHPLCMFSSSF